MASDSVAVTAANNGGGLAVHHMQAHECVNYIICEEGIFLSRS
jgi:microcystin-dependent protein